MSHKTTYMGTERCYVVLDTESSVCLDTGRRVLVSLAYEVVDVCMGADREVVRDLYYDIVSQPPHTRLDSSSAQVHGISVERSRTEGRPVHEALSHLFAVLNHCKPYAIVGHDIVGDIKLLVGEALRAGIPLSSLGLLRKVLCTKELSIAQCRLPLPEHIQECDRLLLHEDEKVSSCMYKWPSLEESYTIIVQNQKKPMYKHHDARETRNASNMGMVA